MTLLSSDYRPSNNLLSNDLDSVLSMASAVFSELRGARIFVTGGTGFFGTWVLESLLWANKSMGLKLSVVVLTRDPESFARRSPHLAADPSLELYHGDVINFNFPQGGFTHVIHAAMDARASLFQDNPLLMLDTIVTGTRRVVEFAVARSARRFLLVSTGGVYGPLPTDIPNAPENVFSPFILGPASIHAEGKRTAEAIAHCIGSRGEIDLTIARCFAFVGPYLPLDTHFAAGNFIRDYLSGGPIRVGGDGTPWRSYMYPTDLVVWLLTILTRGRAQTAYNVGAEHAVTIAGLANIVANLTEKPLEVIVAKIADSDAAAARYVPSTLRARTELGLAETVGLTEALLRTLHWNRAVRGG